MCLLLHCRVILPTYQTNPIPVRIIIVSFVEFSNHPIRIIFIRGKRQSRCSRAISNQGGTTRRLAMSSKLLSLVSLSHWSHLNVTPFHGGLEVAQRNQQSGPHDGWQRSQSANNVCSKCHCKDCKQVLTRVSTLHLIRIFNQLKRIKK